MTVRELLARYPSTMSVFIQLRMLCVGCPTEVFHTVADVARIHGLDVGNWLEILSTAIAAEDHLDADTP